MRNLMAALGRSTEIDEAPAKSSGTGSRNGIFLIDDDPVRLREMRVALAEAGYRVETSDADASAMRRISLFQPDLIVVNPQVTDSEGGRMARRLLADEDLIAIPIVALTESNASGAPPKSAGWFDQRLEKPGDVRVFSDQVRACMHAAGQAPPSQPGEGALMVSPAGDRQATAKDLLDAIEAGLPDSQFAPDTATGLHRLVRVVGGLRHPELAECLQQAERLSNITTARARSRFRALIGLCRELIDSQDAAPGMASLRSSYLDHRREEVNGLARLLGRGDFAALRKAGHNLKGTGAAYGFAELTDIGRELEAAAKEQDATAIQVLLDRIEEYIGIVHSALHSRSNYAGT